MPSNTPQLDSEELLLAIQISLPMNDGGKIVVDKYHLQEFIENYCKKHRAAFADRVLAVVPEIQDHYPDCSSVMFPDDDICTCGQLAWNQAVAKSRAAIANLVAEERGEK